MQSLEMLFEGDAEANQADYDGDTALHLATFSHQTECVALLLQLGANVNFTNIKGHTPVRPWVVSTCVAVHVALSLGLAC